MTQTEARRISYQVLSRRLTCVAETLDSARCYLAHAAQDAPENYTDTPSLDRSLIGLNDLKAFLCELAAKAHEKSEVA